LYSYGVQKKSVKNPVPCYGFQSKKLALQLFFKNGAAFSRAATAFADNQPQCRQDKYYYSSHI
jgi:hypothetical protein